MEDEKIPITVEAGEYDSKLCAVEDDDINMSYGYGIFNMETEEKEEIEPTEFTEKGNAITQDDIELPLLPDTEIWDYTAEINGLRLREEVSNNVITEWDIKNGNDPYLFTEQNNGIAQADIWLPLLPTSEPNDYKAEFENETKAIREKYYEKIRTPRISFLANNSKLTATIQRNLKTKLAKFVEENPELKAGGLL